MIFSNLSERFFSGSEFDRTDSLLEFASYAGEAIPGGEGLQQTTFVARGDGRLEYWRRGDFMERGDAFPGIWTAKCAPSDIANVWNKLGDLGPESFPSRVADPGEGRSRISACIPPHSETLSWGPLDHSRPAPGAEFMAELNPLILRSIQGEPLWCVEMKQIAIAHSQQGLEVDIELVNHGSQAIGFVLPHPSEGGGFKLRHALARKVMPGVTPLPVSWSWEDLLLPNQRSSTFWILSPKSPIKIHLVSSVSLENGRSYLGKIEYEQGVYLDRFIGHSILTGACFTSAFSFEI